MFCRKLFITRFHENELRIFTNFQSVTHPSPLTPDRPQVKKPPPSLQITSDFLVFHGLSHGSTLEKKDVEQNLTYSKI